MIPEPQTDVAALIAKAERVRKCVFIAVEEPVARDISATIGGLLDALATLTATVARVSAERDELQLIADLDSTARFDIGTRLALVERREAEQGAQVREAFELLSGVEWVHIGAQLLHCPRCGNTKLQGHSATCRLALYLTSRQPHDPRDQDTSEGER